MARLSILVLLILPTLTRADDWKPAASPLMTRWAKDVTPDKVHPEYPRPQMVREKWQNLNGLWQFAEAKANDAPPIGKDLAGKILVPFPVESALSGVGKRMERLWYRRTFEVPKDWAGQRVLLHFGAVDWEAKVWLNGKSLGEHRGGYDNFSFDLTEHLKKDGPQELIVGVYDPSDAGYQPRGKQVRKPEGIWYTPSTGIWQTVWIEPVPDVYIESLTVTPSVKNGRVRIAITLNRPMKDVVYLVLEANSAAGVIYTESDSRTAIEYPVMGRPRIWSPDDPHLYSITISDGKGGDWVTTHFAFRTIELGKDADGTPRLMLNGKPYFMVAPLDQGFWPDGLHTAPTDEAMKYDLEMTKKLGFNTTRKHIKVEPARWYHYCDKMGLLVWQDMPSGDGFPKQGEKEIKRSAESIKQYDLELKRMIDQLHNFPCIVMWVPFNEGWGQFDTVRVADWIKKYDPTRLVNHASGWNDMGAGDVNDVHIYPGPGAPKPEAKRAAVLGEFGGLGLSLKGHLWNEKTWSYQGVSDSEALTRKYEKLMRRVYELKEKQGLCAAVYTQITDVEVEANGLLTYDRAVIKVDVERIAAANRGDFSRVPTIEVVVPTAKEKAATWRYSIEKPGDDWFKPTFDDSSWKTGESGFGTRMTPGTMVRTEWNTKDIWLRREIELSDDKFKNYLLLIHHDEDAEVYINGVLAAKVQGFTTEYDEFSISQEAKKSLKKGKNVIAVHCKQTGGGQYIDVGLGRVK